MKIKIPANLAEWNASGAESWWSTALESRSSIKRPDDLFEVISDRRKMLEVGMEILLIVGVYVIGVAIDTLMANRADRADYDHTVVARLSRYAGQGRQLG